MMRRTDARSGMTTAVAAAAVVILVVVGGAAGYYAFLGSTTSSVTTTTNSSSYTSTSSITSATSNSSSTTSVRTTTSISSSSSIFSTTSTTTTVTTTTRTSSSSSSASTTTSTSSCSTSTSSYSSKCSFVLPAGASEIIIPQGIDDSNAQQLGITFEPENLVVQVGVNNTIFILNEDPAYTGHVIQSISVPQGGQVFGAYDLLDGWSANFTLTTPGIYYYQCTWHPVWMEGQITVLPAAS